MITPGAVYSYAEDGVEGAIRLVDRVDVNGYSTGTLQVFIDGAWGGVCDTGFDDRGAAVACQQLGFPSGIRRPQDFRADPEIGGDIRFTDPESVCFAICMLLYTSNTASPPA